MSQDRTEIRFSLPAAARKKLAPAIDLANRLSREQGAGPVEVSNSGQKFRISIEFCALEEPERTSVLTALQDSGATEIVCTTWFDKVGESLEDRTHPAANQDKGKAAESRRSVSMVVSSREEADLARFRDRFDSLSARPG